MTLDKIMSCLGLQDPNKEVEKWVLKEFALYVNEGTAHCEIGRNGVFMILWYLKPAKVCRDKAAYMLRCKKFGYKRHRTP